MGKRGPKQKFTDVVCPNEDCKFHGISGQGNIVGNGTYQPKTVELENTYAENAVDCSVTA